MANLLVALMDKLDVPVERLGGSTGKLPLIRSRNSNTMTKIRC